MDVVVAIRKLVIVSVRKCCRSVHNHPFLVGFVCFLFLLYRSFPVLFSLLVSASPILVCTAVLLGTLLSFGEPRLPEIEKEERVSREMSPLKTGVFGNSTVVMSRDEGSTAERFIDDKRDIIERAIERVVSANSEARMLGKEDVMLESTPLIHDHSSLSTRGGNEKRESEGADREDEEDEDEEKGRDLDGSEIREHRYSLIDDAGDDVRVENGELKRELTDAYVESSLGSKFKGVDKEEEEDEEEEEEDDDDNLSHSESDHAESSSPDASMADILPMLDELHPLLDREDPQANASRNESDVASERSRKSENGHKNLMDLGTSELERNQRLENLIARRRARRMMAEKNLIDFDGSDLPFNVPSIATTRRNPFDGPDDSYSDMGLPPIPGSAPSILLLRRNPFDLPYEPNEEKPDLKEDSFQQEIVADPPTQPPYHNQQKDNFFFRRHESFSVGPSSLGLSRQERHDVKWKPYFVPEHFASEGTSFQSFERQSSGMSESKASSVPDTESVTSAVDHEDKMVNEPEEFIHETEEMSNVDRASLLVEHGSATSEDIDDREIDEEEEKKRNARHDEVEITLGDAEAETESPHDIGSNLSEEGIGTSASAPPFNVNVNGFEEKRERIEQEEEEPQVEDKEEQQQLEEEKEEEEKEELNSSRSGSSSSSVFSEVDKKIDEVKKEGEEASSLQLNYPNEELRPQVEDVEFSFMTDYHKEPVYDSSPKYLSFSSDSSDLPAHTESEVFEENMQNIDHDNGNDTRNTEVTENREDNFHRIESLGSEEEILAYQSGTSVVREADNEQVSSFSSSPSSGIESVGNDLVNDSYLHPEHNTIETQPSNLSSVMTEVAMDVEEPFPSEQAKTDSPSHEMLVDNIRSNHDQVQREEHQVIEVDMDVQFHDTVERRDTPASSHWNMLSDLLGEPHDGEHQFVHQERSVPLQELSEMYEEQLVSDGRPSFDETNEELEPSVVLEESAEEIIATHSQNPEETHDDGGKESLVVSALTSKSPSFSSSSNYESPTAGPDSRDQTAGGNEYRILQRQITEYYDPSLEVFGTLALDEALNEGGHEDIKDIDEGFLMELDTVGDFRIEETGNRCHSPELVHEDSKGEHSESKSLHLSVGSSNLPVLEARSVEDITMAFRQLDEGADVEEVILPSSINDDCKALEGTESGLPVIEARSFDDVHVVKHSVEELAEEMDGKSPSVEDSVSKGNNDIDEVKDSNIPSPSPGSSNLPVLEARSAEDVTMAFKQLDEGAEVEEIILPSSIKNQQDSESSEGASSGLPVVEARSLDDVTMAFKQLDEGAEIEEVILPSSIKNQQDSESSEGASSGLPVVEARSLDDIHNIVKQVVEENHEEAPEQIVESEVTQEVKEVNSTVATTSEPEVQGIASVVSPGEPRDAEVSTSKPSDSSEEKVRSRKSNSGSSSSSSLSSSSSDSD
ncbi:hypothetical protein CDL15_Pgr001253 [Punica granatum]|uniref:Uncharacterized protein n=1 Tax=Punica granatum TaxID=22663 RepID=A0A218WKZ0_PUNGR|nr:hypothetical protein CDL15_Pgr001253 [Punica granatum]